MILLGENSHPPTYFITEAIPFLSFGKLRGSYGLTGNDQISDYQYLNSFVLAENYGDNLLIQRLPLQVIWHSLIHHLIWNLPQLMKWGLILLPLKMPEEIHWSRSI